MGNSKLTIDELKTTIAEMGERAVIAGRQLALLTAVGKNQCLENMAVMLEKEKSSILAANQKDVDNGIKNGLSSVMIDRLRLTEKRISDMANGLRQLIGLEDPVGQTLSTCVRPNGLEIRKASVPIGVISVVYESRPNVTIDAAGLCLKSGNAVILRGGSESIHSNIALTQCVSKACVSAGIGSNAVQLIPWTDREAVSILLKMRQYIDLIIPRGGEQLIRKVVEESTIPVIKHYKGVCNIFVDKNINFDAAVKIIENAKCQRPGVCNAVEHVLIHNDIADDFVPILAKKLMEEGVELRGDKIFCDMVPDAKQASEQDWYEEYLDMIISIKIVPDIEAAIYHINRYGSKHSDSILTNDKMNAEKFMREVDSAVIYHNASTRFTDGFEFGMGAEIGISTDKIHARGPMGLKELVSYKYLVYGNGQVRS